MGRTSIEQRQGFLLVHNLIAKTTYLGLYAIPLQGLINSFSGSRIFCVPPSLGDRNPHEKWAPCLNPITIQRSGPLVCLIRPPPPPPPPPPPTPPLLPQESFPPNTSTEQVQIENKTDGSSLVSIPPTSTLSNPPLSSQDTKPTSNLALTPPSLSTTAASSTPTGQRNRTPSRGK